MLSETELALLENRCRPVPLTSSEYVATDFVMALFDTARLPEPRRDDPQGKRALQDDALGRGPDPR